MKNGAKPGRGAAPKKRKRDAEDTRRRILEAATVVFAREGYNGARVEVICTEAESNPRLLYYHFGDKEGLYLAVLERVLGELREEELALDVDGVEPIDGILQLFEFVHHHFETHPELIQLLSGENLLRASFLKKSKKAPLLSSPLVSLIRKLLAKGVKQGVFRAKIDAVHLYVMMVALSYFHRSNAHTLSAIFQSDLLDPQWQDKHREYGAEMLRLFVQRAH